jgi:hypothetical protein
MTTRFRFEDDLSHELLKLQSHVEYRNISAWPRVIENPLTGNDVHIVVRPNGFDVLDEAGHPYFPRPVGNRLAVILISSL